MVPFWKLKREALRLFNRLRTLLHAPFRGRYQRAYDLRRRQTARITRGALALGPRIAVLVLFQPRGIAPSVFGTLRNLADNGAAPFVISNAPLSPGDRDALEALSALVMTRENFGYDFGAYRDAMLYLDEAGIPYDSVIFLNDSVWFPLDPGNRHVSQMLAMPAHLIGYNFATAQSGRQNAHAQSYFFAFTNLDPDRKAALLAYWRDLRVASDREFTIRQGEMRMTRHFIERGFSVSSLFGLTDLEDGLDAAAPEDLERLVAYLTLTAHRRARVYRKMFRAGPEAVRAALRTDARHGRFGRNLIGAEPVLVFDRLGFAAMKKSGSYTYMAQKRAYLASGAHRRLDPVILTEISAQFPANQLPASCENP